MFRHDATSAQDLPTNGDTSDGDRHLRTRKQTRRTRKLVHTTDSSSWFPPRQAGRSPGTQGYPNLLSAFSHRSLQFGLAGLQPPSRQSDVPAPFVPARSCPSRYSRPQLSRVVHVGHEDVSRCWRRNSMSLISDTTKLHPANALRCEHTKLNSELGSRSHITGVMGMPRVFYMIYPCICSV